MPPRSPVMDMGLCNWSEIRISYLGVGVAIDTDDLAAIVGFHPLFKQVTDHISLVLVQDR